MAWSAKIIDIEKKVTGSMRIVAQITDGTIKKPLEYNIVSNSQNLEWLKDNLRNEIANLTNIDPGILNLKTGPIDLS